MGDFQFWLYVIIGVIYLISRVMKKPAEQNDFPDYDPEKPVRTDSRPKAPTESHSQPKALTFEELLREISEGKTVGEKPVPAQTKPHYSYEEQLTEEEEVEEASEVLEDQRFDYRKDKVVEVYEQAKREAFLRPSLEETMDLSQTEVKYGRFKEFDQEQKRNQLESYLSGLKDPEGLKKAVVMSEILQRKF
jgi:hypothetical protein